MKTVDQTKKILSIDVDDYVLTCFAFYKTKTSIDERYRTNIDYQLRFVLDLLSECNCKATFFICTFLVKEFEKTLGKIVDEGHMIGSHGHHHYNFNNVSIQDFKADIQQSLEILSHFQQPI